MEISELNLSLSRVLSNKLDATTLPNEIAFRLEGFGKAWICKRNSCWIVTGTNGSGKSYLASILADKLPLHKCRYELAPDLEESRAVVTFSQQQNMAMSSWLQSRWHGLNEVEDPTVETFLTYESVHDINPFEVVNPSQRVLAEYKRFYKKIVAQLELTSLLSRTIPQLSNGETRLVLLAKALLTRPKLLILDDPFAGLSYERRASLKFLLDDLSSTTTLILMLRNIDEIPSCATDELLLEDMKIVRFKVPSKKSLRSPRNQWQLPASTSSNKQSGNPVVEIEALTIAFGKRKIINNLNWRVLEGERWLITGPNGSGKTTLLSLITGDNPAAYSYPIRIFGKPRRMGTSVWSIRSRIAQISPEIQAYFDPALTVMEAVTLHHTDQYGQSKALSVSQRRQALKYLELLNLTQHLQTPFGELSAGEQRLVLFARAFTANPQLLILDEPCLNLDRTTRKIILDLLSNLLKLQKNLTVLFVAHRQEYVPKGFDYRLELGNP